MSKGLEALRELVSNVVSYSHTVDVESNYKTIKNELEQLEKYKAIEEEIGCPLVVVFKALLNNEPILVQNPVTKTIQEIQNPYKFYDPKRYAFDIRCENFEDTYKSYIWNTGGAFFYLKEYQKTWWLKEDRSE